MALAPPPKPPGNSPQWVWDQYKWLLGLYEAQGTSAASGERLDRAERHIRSLLARSVDSGSAERFVDLTDTPSSITDGDVYYGQTDAIQRLAKGTDGQVLTLSSGVPDWMTPTAGSPWEQIERSTFSASSSESIGSTSVDPTDYDMYRLIIQITSLSADADVEVWASADGGTTKITDTSELTGVRHNNTPDSHVNFDVTGTVLFAWNTIDADATNQAATAEVSLYFPSNGKYKDVHIRNFWNDNGGPKHSMQDRYTLVNNTSDIDSFIMEPSTGTMTGVWVLTGLKVTV